MPSQNNINCRARRSRSAPRTPIAVPSSPGISLPCTIKASVRRAATKLDAYADELLGKIAALSSEALGKLAPARVQWGSGKCTFAVNRRENKEPEVPDKRTKGLLAGPSDHDVPVLSVRDAEGTLRAVLFGYACHATVLSGQTWNADYPGYAQMELEKKVPRSRRPFLGRLRGRPKSGASS
jgi:hypothetical protein